MESFAGADLHKRVTQLAVLRDGQPPSQFRFPNDPKTVHGVLKKLPRGTQIAVEATGSWWWFVEKARELGHEVCLSHPKQTKAIAHHSVAQKFLDLPLQFLRLRTELLPLRKRHTAKRTQNCRENPLLPAQIFHAQLLQIFAVFYFVDLGEKRFFEFGN